MCAAAGRVAAIEAGKRRADARPSQFAFRILTHPAQPLWLMWAGRSLVFDRFDLATAVLMLLAIALFVDRHERLAWVVIGLATALKLYPLVVTPLLALATGQRRRRDQAVGDAAAFLAAILVPSVVVAHGDLVAVAAFLKYHIARGLEIETVYASALMLGCLMGHHVSQTWGYGGNEIVAPLAPLLTSLTLPLTVLALGAVYRVAWRRRHGWADTPALVDDLARLSAAAVLAFMLAGKVLSPQYLLWLYPLLPLLGRRRLRAWGVFGVALLLSQWIFPEHYYQLVRIRSLDVPSALPFFFHSINGKWRAHRDVTIGAAAVILGLV